MNEGLVVGSLVLINSLESPFWGWRGEVTALSETHCRVQTLEIPTAPLNIPRSQVLEIYPRSTEGIQLAYDLETLRRNKRTSN